MTARSTKARVLSALLGLGCLQLDTYILHADPAGGLWYLLVPMIALLYAGLFLVLGAFLP